MPATNNVNSFNNIAIVIAILLFAAIIIRPTMDTGSIDSGDQPNFLSLEILGDGKQAITPIPQSLDLDSGKVSLGEKLFSDPLLSGNGFSCATCHPVDRGGMDGLPQSIVTGGGFDVINTPTVFNSGFNSLQLWNGEKHSLEEQIDGVINNPKHMDSSWPLIIARLERHEEYGRLFRATYGEGVNRANILDAITTYERSLTTPDSNFDRYLRGDNLAINEEQKEGYRLFQQYGCISCHQGINVGGNLFAKFGIFEKDPSGKKTPTEYDLGRYAYTGKTSDRHVFRVPGLRNVAHTAPYFHDGSVAKLSDAIATMARVQLDIELDDKDIRSIEAFLISLSGQYKGNNL